MLQEVRRSLVQVINGHHGAGAGVVWKAGGYVLTNHHVIGRGTMRVILENGDEIPAKLAARDPDIDLALLQIEWPSLPPARISDSRLLQPGQLVFALGHPWGQKDYLTSGIISSLTTASTRSGRLIPIIRSDAPLAPGNSGGPLVDAAGGVVGINTMIIGGDQGVAITSQVADQFVDLALKELYGAKEGVLI